ncbi:MAG: hypothetical protein OQK82_05545 [Candidatus Pacearchaeota archaeon]|nr:hypothetical protein [Candidatus Pacearchaeota archaeon]
MGFKKGLTTTVRAADAIKQKLEPGIDKTVAFGFANIEAIYQVSDFIDKSDYSDPTNAAIMMLSGATLAGANYFALNSNILHKCVGGINFILDKIRPISWIKTGALIAGLTIAGNNLQPYTSQIIEDLNSDESRSKIERIVSEDSSKKIARNELRYTPISEYNFAGTKLAPKNSTIGRIQRTLRWKPIYSQVEKKYNIPENTLGAMIMQESYGDPVQPNSGNDGGLGIVHIQGTTAKRYGLDIFGSSKKSHDRIHGNQIRKMLEKCKYDPVCVQKYDDRAHLIKVLDTAARIISEGKEKHGTWDFGVEYYRAPAKVGRNLTWRYLQDVKTWKSAIQNKNMIKRASRDFQKRNGHSFNEYLSKWHKMNNNWGLSSYKKL